MNVREVYRTSTSNHDFGFKEYVTPGCDCDPKKQIIQRQYADYKHKRRQGKFKVTTRPKVCFFDELAKQTNTYPEPSRYKVEGDMIRRTKSASMKKEKVDFNSRRGTYIDNIEEFQTKHKPPGIGKFDLTKYSVFQGKKTVSPKDKQLKTKHNNFDDAIKLAAELPGPGQFNPHKSVEKIRPNRTDMKFWKQKHENEHKKSAKSLSTKMGPSTYNPVPYGTFSYTAKDKSKPTSRWSHGTIEIRKGIRSMFKEPSPSHYNTMHQWGSLSGKEKKIGSLDLLNRISSARSFGVYH